MLEINFVASPASLSPGHSNFQTNNFTLLVLIKRRPRGGEFCRKAAKYFSQNTNQQNGKPFIFIDYVLVETYHG